MIASRYAEAGDGVRASDVRPSVAVDGTTVIDAERPIALIALSGNLLLSKHLARTVAFVGKQTPAAGARATMTRDGGIGRRGGWPGQPLPPQLFHAATDRLEIVGCSGP